jgi:hypothetical protein
VASHAEGPVKPDPTPVAEPLEKPLCRRRGRRSTYAPTILARTTLLGFFLRIRLCHRLNPVIHHHPLLIRCRNLSR